MPKTTHEILLDEIGDNLITFLKNGNLTSFTRKIDHELNIDRVETLLRIHFILKPETIAFIDTLQNRIRRIKTATIPINEQQQGTIKGCIDWNQTIKLRCSTNINDPTLFSVNRMEREYTIPENIVLKKILYIINDIIEHDVSLAITENYPWLKKWTTNNLITILKTIYHKNIYLRRINLQDAHVTDRMIVDTLKSRNNLYKDAAELLYQYQKIINYDINPKEAKELLKNTFISTEKTEVLFELYWTFKLIKTFEKKAQTKVTFHLIGAGTNIVAEWEDNQYIYTIYHNSTGTFRFHEPMESIKIPVEDGFLKRQGKIYEEWINLSKTIFSKQPTDTLWGGRPDILIEQRNKNTHNLEKVFIGEVKYTTNPDYAAQGLRELLEYMALIKNHNRYLEENPNIIYQSPKIEGFLFLDDIAIQKEAIDNINIITITSQEQLHNSICLAK